MVSAALHLIPYALVAALSPLGFAATITVMRTGRLKALGFGVGVVVGQFAALTTLVALGAATTPQRTKAYPTFEGVLELALGLGLVTLSVAVHRRPELATRSTGGRSQALLDRLGRVHLATAAAVGLLLGIGGPKRLVLTALASASITAAGMTGSNEAFLVGWYALLATSLVWFPVLAYLMFGTWASRRLDAALEWLGRYGRAVTVYALALVGIALIVDGALLL